MKLYPTIVADIPELSTLTRAQRRKIIRSCMRKALRSRRFWRIFILPQLVFFVVFGAVMFYLAGHVGDLAFVIACVAGLVIATVAAVVGSQYLIRFLIPYVRELLPGYCSTCGYNLTGNTSGVCPECGTGKPA